MPTFGNTSIKTETDADWAGYVLMCKFALSEEGTIATLHCYTELQTGDMRLAIYDDDAGAPKNVQCETGTQAVASGWNTLTPTTTPTLPAADYWLAVQLSYDGDSVHYQAGEASQFGYRAHEWGAFPDPVGPPTYQNLDYSIYATYSVLVLAGFAGIF